MSAFVSHDGDGTEVFVTTARVKITEIEERDRSVNVKFDGSPSGLKHPMNGWLNTGEEVLNTIRQAKEKGEEVEVRIEAQRKPKVDKTIPIQDIRDGKNAKTDIIKKIACVNGVFTSEALTNPEDDPDTGKAKSALGRTSAPQQNSSNSSVPAAGKDTVLGLLRNLATSRDVTESVVDALKAQALIAGASIQEITEASSVAEQTTPALQNGFAREGAPFKEYNGDGRLNLGGAAVAAGVGVYNFVFEKLAKTNLGAAPKNETVEFLSALVLSIADVIQVGAYGQGFRVDRTAGSHTRVRASLFTVIELNPFPVTANGEVESVEVVNAWVKKVGAEARHNLVTGITLSQQFPTVKTLLDFIGGNGEEQAPTPKATESVSKPVEEERVTSAPQSVIIPAEERTAAPEPVSEPTVEEIAEPEPTVQEPVTAPAPTVAPVAAPEEKEEVSTPNDNLLRFEQKLLPPGAINAANAPDDELLTQFKDFVIEEVGLKTKAEQAQVGKLLGATFGRAYNKASNIPYDDLADFLDFYISAGVENFKAVLDSM